MFELPTSIIIDDNQYPIRKQGDYRMVLDCFDALGDVELDDQNRILTCLIIFYDGVKSESDLLTLFGTNLTCAATKMFEFFNCGQPQTVGAKFKHQLINWSKDEQLIAGAVNSVARQEIRSIPYLHWWTFVGYYMSVGEGPLSTVVSIRHKIKSNKKLEKYEIEFKRDNPQYFNWEYSNHDDYEDEQLLRDLWDSGGD